MDQAVAEIHRARTDLDLRGITMCDAPHLYGFPSLDDPAWDGFWSACEDQGVPVAFHIGSGSGGQFVWGQHGGEEQATRTVNTFFSNSWVVTNLIFSGVLLKHPRLKIFSAETGIGWIPFLLDAMDYHWYENISDNVRREVWKDLTPTEIFRRNCYVSFWFEKFGPAHCIDVIGEDNVMFETDFPHGTTLTERVTEQVAQTLAALTPQVRQKVLHDNAAKLYGG
jgi:predicted TIM-barrel fold metal-dependent hydrolase